MAIQQLNRGQSGLGLLAQALGAGLSQNLKQQNNLSTLSPIFGKEHQQWAQLLASMPQQNWPALLEILPSEVWAANAPQAMTQPQQQMMQEQPSLMAPLQQGPMGQPRTPSSMELLQSQVSRQPVGIQQLFPGQQDTSRFPREQMVPQGVPQQMIPQPEVAAPERKLFELGSKSKRLQDQQLKREQFEQKKRTEEERKISSEQKALGSQYKKYNEEIDSQRRALDEIEALTQQYLNLAQQGKVLSGIKATFKPSYNLEPEEREGERLIASITGAQASAMKGPHQTIGKIRLAAQQKIDARSPLATQIYSAEQILNNVKNFKRVSQVRDQIIKENNDQFPKNLQGKVNSRLDLLGKLPEDLGEGAVFEVDGELYTLSNGIPVKA